MGLLAASGAWGAHSNWGIWCQDFRLIKIATTEPDGSCAMAKADCSVSILLRVGQRCLFQGATVTRKVCLLDSDATATLIGQIYSAAAGRQSWEPALDAISTHCDCWAVQLLAVDKRDGAVLFSHYGGGASPQAHLEYLRTYQYIDPRAPLVFAPRY